MTMAIDMATTKEFGGAGPEGEVLRPSRLQTLGSTQGQMLAKLYVFVIPPDPVEAQKQGIEVRDPNPHWEEWDTLMMAHVENNDDGSTTVLGVSTKLVHVIGLTEEDSQVRWEVAPRGCTSCK